MCRSRNDGDKRGSNEKKRQMKEDKKWLKETDVSISQKVKLQKNRKGCPFSLTEKGG
jgi:hypothetical protein